MYIYLVVPTKYKYWLPGFLSALDVKMPFQVFCVFFLFFPEIKEDLEQSV